MGGLSSSGLPRTAAGNRTRFWSFTAQFQWLREAHVGHEGASQQTTEGESLRERFADRRAMLERHPGKKKKRGNRRRKKCN